MFRGVGIETKKSSVRGRLIVVVIAIIAVIVIERYCYFTFFWKEVKD